MSFQSKQPFRVVAIRAADQKTNPERAIIYYREAGKVLTTTIKLSGGIMIELLDTTPYLEPEITKDLVIRAVLYRDENDPQDSNMMSLYFGESAEQRQWVIAPDIRAAWNEIESFPGLYHAIDENVNEIVKADEVKQ